MPKNVGYAHAPKLEITPVKVKFPSADVAVTMELARKVVERRRRKKAGWERGGSGSVTYDAAG